MRYFDLMDDVHVPMRWHLGMITTDDGWEPQLRSGVPFEGRVSAEVTHPGRSLDFCLTSYAVPVATSALAAAIESAAGGDVQRVPVRIPGRAGFEVLNALRVIACLDESRSEFLKWTERDHRADLAGQYRQVTTLALDGARIPPGANVFRVGGWRIALVVSEAVKDAMDRAGCVGAWFQLLPS